MTLDGTEKLLGEMILDAYIEKGYFKGCSTRSFTVYGPLMGAAPLTSPVILATVASEGLLLLLVLRLLQLTMQKPEPVAA